MVCNVDKRRARDTDIGAIFTFRHYSPPPPSQPVPAALKIIPILHEADSTRTDRQQSGKVKSNGESKQTCPVHTIQSGYRP